MQSATTNLARQRCLLPVSGNASGVKGVSVDEFKRCFADMLGHGEGLEKVYEGRGMAVAISGGPDSTALLMLMRRAFPNAKLHAYMVDHGMDKVGVSEEPERVQEEMRQLGVSFQLLKADWSDCPLESLTVGKRLLRAREKRYNLLATACSKDDVGLLLLGHNMDDDIVTMLYRMSRFSGLDGISAMRPLSTIPAVHPDAAGVLMGRPLLGVEKCRLVETCRELNVGVTADRSNECLEYARNQILDTIADLQQQDPNKFATGRLRNLLLSMKQHHRTIHARIRTAMDESVFLDERQGQAVIVSNNHESMMESPVWNRIVSYLLQFVGAKLTPVRTSVVHQIVDRLQTSSTEHQARRKRAEQRSEKLVRALPFQTPLPSNETGRAQVQTLVAGHCVLYPLARSDAALRIEAVKKNTERKDVKFGPSFLVQSELARKPDRILTLSLLPNQPILYDGRFWLHYQTLNPQPTPLTVRIEPLSPELATRFKRTCFKKTAVLAKRALQAFQAVTPGNMMYNVPCITMPDMDPDYMALPAVGGGIQVCGAKDGLAVKWVVRHAGMPTVISKFHCIP